MHDGCPGPGDDGKLVVNKVRAMGFAGQPMPTPLEITCAGCGHSFAMTTFEATCPECHMVHAVTPCSADDPSNVKAAGIDY